MVLSHYKESGSSSGGGDNAAPLEPIPATEEDILHAKPSARTSSTAAEPQDVSVTALLKRLLQESEQRLHQTSRPRRPCGYVFKRGDIAWNCRTCQADPTCVICDDCFRDSNHEGHEVYFHRTTPGGCCDCGDVEAWNVDGCCERHRPAVAEKVASSTPTLALDDPLEAVRMAATARQWAEETLTSDPATHLPPRLMAALGVVVGAAVQCLLDAVDGSGAGADCVQWSKRWADEAARIANAAPHNEDYYYLNSSNNNNDSSGSSSPEPATVQTFVTLNKNFPENFRLQLRLHNDDVHTFDEVIDALHEPRHLRRNTNNTANNNEEQHPSLVSLRENATEMTHHVDADGQVTVKTYNNIASAMKGFRRLKSRGLHCSVVSTVQVDMEHRARALCSWLTDLAAAHPVAQALLVQGLLQLPANGTQDDGHLAGIYVWHPARMIPPWAAMQTVDVSSGQVQYLDEVTACRRRFEAFPPHLASSFVTREEAELLHGMALTSLNSPAPAYNRFLEITATVPDFYSKVPYRLPSQRYHKSPHALWGTLPAQYSDPLPAQSKHPLLKLIFTGQSKPDTKNRLSESIFLVDTDLRKQQEGERITISVFPHKLPGLNMISGIGMTRVAELSARRPPLPSPMDLRHLLATSSFRAPLSPILLLLLLDPYPTKQLRGALHALFLSLLTNGRFKSRFAAALALSYRPLSTLFCAGVGTEADTPLHFTVQIFTAGSIVRALGHGAATEKLFLSDQGASGEEANGDATATAATASIGVFLLPISHIIARCIHTNLLGATKEVNMILNHTATGNDDDSQDESSQHGNIALLPALTYVAGEHPLMTLLPAAPDDGFLDSRSTRHKRLPHLLRDLDYVIETPGTAMRLLLPSVFPVYQGPSLSFRGEDVLAFPSIFTRMLRLAQGMDPQKRKISGGHVEYEQNRWLEAFGLSLNFGGTRDALAESPCSANTAGIDDASHLAAVREAMGNIIASLLREVKLWLYREGMLETGLPIPPGGPTGGMDLAQAEALQRSTLHVSSSQLGGNDGSSSISSATDGLQGASSSVALSCATGVKMTEAQLTLIENALRVEAAQRLEQPSLMHGGSEKGLPSTEPIIGDWLRVPHSPLAGDSLSFHLPLHRALAKCIRSICSVVIPEVFVAANPNSWWKIPVLDVAIINGASADPASFLQNPLVPLIRPTLRSSNCRVVWSAGPDCTPQEAQRRRSRSRTVSANIAVAKIIHSLADHPIRCLAAAQQIERHLWARNGNSVAGMAMNYSSSPLCRSFRDLDLLLVQLSAAGMSCGLGARRIFSLLLSRFSMDGYLCDPERRSQIGAAGSTGQISFGSPTSMWVNPPRLQDADHAVILAESFFSTVCVLVTELPAPPPTSSTDDSSLRRSIRRELIHALAAEPRSHSEAMSAASCGISRREETEGTSGNGGTGGLFRNAFASVLREIGKQKSQSTSRAASGPPTFELKAEYCDEYDPTFFHLRRQEHQHAMDVVARLRRKKWGDKEVLETHCLPLVCVPPKAHPRFLPCRLLLHLDSMDAALRRSLLFAMTNGSWLPPSEPASASSEEAASPGDSEIGGVTTAVASSPGSADVPMTTFNRRTVQSVNSGVTLLKRPGTPAPTPFSGEVVAASSVSFLEVLQLLTLQAHTLEECASLHRTLPDLDDEARSLSSRLSINTYLGRLVRVPESLADVWALRPHPGGPLVSNGSGENRGSILGLLIALYEHRGEHRSILNADGGDYTQADDGHGGARSLASSGLKWLLRFVSALVDGAPSVGAAVRSATTGKPVQARSFSMPITGDHGSGVWTIDDQVMSTIRGMLKDLADLWPKHRAQSPSTEKSNAKSKEARKAAQLRVMEMMKKKQAAFAATIAPTDTPSEGESADQESDLCIICRCDDADGENNGPLGYLGHVQRSRMLQMRAVGESLGQEEESDLKLANMYRVVGHMGCQLRETEAMDSKPLACLAKGSVVSVLKSKVSSQYDVLSRRVLVRHVRKDPQTQAEIVTEGWASVQSSQGYVILSPLMSMCYSNTRWGSTRPIIKQCGHAAHLKCVETHTLSLHQRAAGDQPYDGRFAANIHEGEFLCPLCKQLSNILLPRDGPSNNPPSGEMDVDEPSDKTPSPAESNSFGTIRRKLVSQRSSISDLNPMGRRALEDFGSNLHTAMCVSWERSTGLRKKQQDKWHPAIHKWDYEENDGGVKHLLRLFRQQLIAWAAVGHCAAALEAGARGVETVLPFGVLSETSDPWPEYAEDSVDTHPMLLELKRVLSGSSGLLEILFIEMSKQLADRGRKLNEAPLVASCLVDILEGRSWLEKASTAKKQEGTIALWSELTALISAMPSHVSKDGTIPLRCEARATAAAMWAVKGLPCDLNVETEPPAPFAIKQLFSDNRKHAAIPVDWGSLQPFVDEDNPSALRTPFRLGVACGFLYTPLLAWDLCTFTGAILSCALASDNKDLPTGDDLLRLAHTLLLGRIVQAIVTPGGFDVPDEMDLDEEDCWTEEEASVEGPALAKLVAHCRSVVGSDFPEMPTGIVGATSDLSPPALLAGVGRAILPFARSLVLMLRASTSVIRERHARNGSTPKISGSDNHLKAVLCQGDVMTTEDGFFIAKTLRFPRPTELVGENTNEWLSIINRWLVAIAGFEKHHGSSGGSIVQEASSNVANSAQAQTAAPAPAAAPAAAAAAPAAAKSNDLVFSDESGDDEMAMDVDEPNRVDRVGLIRRTDEDFLFRGDIDDSDEELADSMDDMEDEAEEMVTFDLAADIQFRGNSPAASNGEGGESSDNSSSAMDDGAGGHESDRLFANSSRSPILPYQPSVLGREGVGPGRHGSMFEFSIANGVMADLSHLGLGHQKGIPAFTLIRLPKSFVELYNIVNKVKGREDSAAAMDDSDDIGSSETSICLLTGAVMRSGATRRVLSRAVRPPGACTLHARKTASGIGIFFLVQKCTVLLMHNNKSAYSASLYVDEHGEEDPQLRRGRPLFLNEARYRALELLWRQQRIPREVAQIRSTSDRVIRDNWY